MEEHEFKIGIFQSIDTIKTVKAKTVDEAMKKVIKQMETGEIELYEDAKVQIERVEVLEDEYK